MDGKCRTRVSHYILHPRLVHCDDIGITFHHKHTVFLSNGPLGLEEAIEFPLLMVYLRVRRVHIFLLHTLRPRIQQSSAKGHHPSAHVQPGEDDTSCIAVVHAPLIADAESGLHEILILIAFRPCRQCQCVALRQGITQRELLDDVITDSTAAKILLADGYTVGIFLQDTTEVVLCPFVHNQHRLAVALLLFLLRRQLLLFHLNAVLLCQPAQGLWIGDLLMLHQEIDGRTTLAAGKALANLF